jgi:hexosaminidase
MTMKAGKNAIRIALALGIALLAMSSAAPARQPAAGGALQIVPLPRSVVDYDATYEVPNPVQIAAANDDERNVASFAIGFLRKRGIDATIASNARDAQIVLTTALHDSALGSEGYRLRVGATGVRIEANAGPGLFYGLQTLEQLFPLGSPNAIRQVAIEDAPAYRWRGIHLDVSRHFFPVPVIERYIDVAAHYKLNTFHWHLTDDQGWRIEIKRYPLLTKIGSCRNGTEVDQDPAETDGKRYCGFYTQDQIRRVVAFAKRRYVTIVPEIEMPGHSSAAVAAYPWLACKPGKYQVREIWGVSDDIFCPTPRTFTFLRNVLSEVIALFPGTYVHIGGDEVPKDAWKQSTYVHALMKREHLKTYDDVQGYFTRTIEEYLRSRGRRMVGWDEILGGGVTRTATIMSWRGIDGGLAAARKGNDVVMSPDPTLYLDHHQGDPSVEPLAIGGYTPLEEVYNYDPMPPGLTAEQQSHILGAQGNVWTEYIPTSTILWRRLLPRALAVAELTWTPDQQKSWPNFQSRLPAQYAWMEARGYTFFVPNPTMAVDGLRDPSLANLQPNLRSTDLTISVPTVDVTISDPVPGATVRYTVDGTDPTPRSPKYDAPLHLDLQPGRGTTVKAIAILPDKRVSSPTELVLYREGTR